MFKIYFLLCMTTVALIGCGIKPKTLSPPEGSEKTEFPRQYPDPATDPKP